MRVTIIILIKQLTKITKILEKLLVQRSSEISQLRGEIIALENRTPPHYQDADSRELQRRLRSEIQSLEQYIKQLEDEQEQIRNEKDSVKEKLRTLESQCTIWQDKFFETERSFESVSEQSKKQDEELRILQAHCAELTAMLEEYRYRPTSNDSSMFEQLSETNQPLQAPSCEDLAHSVVEVQLREALKQNDGMKASLIEAEEFGLELKNTIDALSNQLQEAKDSCQRFNDLNKGLESQV